MRVGAIEVDPKRVDTWRVSDPGTESITRHPTTVSWRFPPAKRPRLTGAHRLNLREHAARPGRFEHHLDVVGRVGGAQLECVVASEPLYFAHANISDEYATAMTCGDELLDSFPFRTFLTDAESGRDIGRVNHRTWDLVLHPYGALHWPSRLRPPYSVPPLPPFGRRTLPSFVFCAEEPCVPSERPLFVSGGREADTKPYTDVRVPFLLADLRSEQPRTVARVAEAQLDLVVGPASIDAPHGGYALVLSAPDTPEWFCCDLQAVEPGGRVAVPDGVRLLWAHAFGQDAAGPTPAWSSIPEPPFPVFEDGPRGELPVTCGDLTVSELDATTVAVSVAGAAARSVPRYWLTRMMFRIALHGYQLGYLETYGGFFYDDRQSSPCLGVRDVGSARYSADELPAVVETLYRAVAPNGYVERVGDTES